MLLKTRLKGLPSIAEESQKVASSMLLSGFQTRKGLDVRGFLMSMKRSLQAMRQKLYAIQYQAMLAGIAFLAPSVE